jgi:hypothetical protein
VCGEKIETACLCEEPSISIDMSAYEPDVPADLQIYCDHCGRSLIGSAAASAVKPTTGIWE